MKPIDYSGCNYSDYLKLFSGQGQIHVMSKDLFDKACKFLKSMGLLGRYEDCDTHEVMAPILEGLKRLGYHGIATRETDFNDEDKEHPSSKVTTDYAVGIFDKAGLDMIGLVPMRYEWLKKINPSYLCNSTSETASQKIKRFI